MNSEILLSNIVWMNFKKNKTRKEVESVSWLILEKCIENNDLKIKK